MRKCIFKDEVAIFHGIYQISQVIPPSMLNGGHNGGVVSEPMAVIETIDGNLLTVYLRNVKMIGSEKFIDMTEQWG